jgi:hypothetical protein
MELAESFAHISVGRLHLQTDQDAAGPFILLDTRKLAIHLHRKTAAEYA